MQFPITPLFPLFLSENSQWSVHPTFKWSSQGPGNLRSQAGFSFLYPKCLQFFCLTWSFKARLKSVILLLLVFHFIIYWVLILSSPPCTKRSLWPNTRDKFALCAVINQVPGADGEGLGSILKPFFSYTCGIWSTQKIFDLIAQAFVFKACNNGNNKRGQKGRECELVYVPFNKKAQTLRDFHGEDQWICIGFFCQCLNRTINLILIFYILFLLYYGKKCC